MLTRIPRAPAQIDVFEEGAAHGGLGRGPGPVLARSPARPHHRPALLRHHGTNVREIDVDHARAGDELGDPLHRAEQHVVRRREGLLERHSIAQHAQQLLIGNGNQGIHVLAQLDDPLLRDRHPALELERERLGDHGDGQDPHLARNLCDDRRCTGAGAAAHARGDEHHVGSVEEIDQALAILQRRLAADFGMGAGAEPLGDVGAQLQDGSGRVVLQGLGIGVDTDELDTFDLARHHVLDGVAAAAADPDDANHRVVGIFDQLEHCRLSLVDTMVDDAPEDAGPGEPAAGTRHSSRLEIAFEPALHPSHDRLEPPAFGIHRYAVRPVLVAELKQAPHRWSGLGCESCRPGRQPHAGRRAEPACAGSLRPARSVPPSSNCHRSAPCRPRPNPRIRYGEAPPERGRAALRNAARRPRPGFGVRAGAEADRLRSAPRWSRRAPRASRARTRV